MSSFRFYFLQLQPKLPFDEVAQEVKRVHRLLLVLCERQPADPVRQDVADVDAPWPKPHDFAHSRDAVLRGVDVLLGARVGRVDDAEQQGDGLWREQGGQGQSHNTHPHMLLVRFFSLFLSI